MATCELVTSITAIACTIVNHYTKEEAAVIASAVSQLGDTIATLLAQQELCSYKEEEK